MIEAADMLCQIRGEAVCLNSLLNSVCTFTMPPAVSSVDDEGSRQLRKGVTEIGCMMLLAEVAKGHMRHMYTVLLEVKRLDLRLVASNLVLEALEKVKLHVPEVQKARR